MSEPTPEELVANLKLLRRHMIQDNGFVYVRPYEFELIDDLIKYLKAQDVLPTRPTS